MKTILLLMNGFGIEGKNSYTVYDANILPNIENLRNRYLFQTLTTNNKTMYEGFRNISLEIGELYNYHVFNRELQNMHIFSNSNYQNLKKNLEEKNSKLHLFVFVDKSPMIVENLKNFLRDINKERNKKIFLHLVLTCSNYEDYPLIIETLSKINIELNEEATIGLVFGLETMLNNNPVVELNFFLKMMISEVGEKWQSFSQKLDVSYKTKKSPTSIKPFVVNTGFSLGNDDLCMIWNYDNIDITNFINGIKAINYGTEKKNNISFISLFPIKYTENIPYILNYETATNSLATNMKGLGFKTLVLTESKHVNVLNYYLNGLVNVNNPDISYLSIDNSMYDVDSLVNIINTYPQEFIIINYDVTNVSSIEELQEKLKKIDNVIGGIYKNTEKTSYSIIISSLFGMEKTMPNGKEEICHVIYNKVPIIYIDGFINRKNYLIEEGDVNGLFKICYKTIDKKYPGQSLIVKKNFLYRLVFK